MVQSPVFATGRRDLWLYFAPVIVFVAVEEMVPLKKRTIFDEADDQAAGSQAPSISFMILPDFEPLLLRSTLPP
jgi:hypothetical protein